jgi:hypothetical protein
MTPTKINGIAMTQQRESNDSRRISAVQDKKGSVQEETEVTHLAKMTELARCKAHDKSTQKQPEQSRCRI